jgi:uncharacterized protein YndB with AHSA1/START domain
MGDENEEDATHTQSNRKFDEPIQRAMAVPAPTTHAFTIFTDGLATWWPREFTWAADVLVTIAIEAHAGGRCFERGPHSFTCDWGRVLVWEPPHRLVISWQVSPRREPEPNPAKASEVEVRFVSEGSATTRVEFEHRHLSRHGEGSNDYRAALDAAQGWTYILDCYARAVAE